MIIAELKRPSHEAPSKNGPAYLPTPEEIAAECWLIRKTWSEAEMIRRRVAMPHDLMLASSCNSTIDKQQ